MAISKIKETDSLADAVKIINENFDFITNSGDITEIEISRYTNAISSQIESFQNQVDLQYNWMNKRVNEVVDQVRTFASVDRIEQAVQDAIHVGVSTIEATVLGYYAKTSDVQASINALSTAVNTSIVDLSTAVNTSITNLSTAVNTSIGELSAYANTVFVSKTGDKGSFPATDIPGNPGYNDVSNGYTTTEDVKGFLDRRNYLTYGSHGSFPESDNYSYGTGDTNTATSVNHARVNDVMKYVMANFVSNGFDGTFPNIGTSVVESEASKYATVANTVSWVSSMVEHSINTHGYFPVDGKYDYEGGDSFEQTSIYHALVGDVMDYTQTNFVSKDWVGTGASFCTDGNLNPTAPIFVMFSNIGGKPTYKYSSLTEDSYVKSSSSGLFPHKIGEPPYRPTYMDGYATVESAITWISEVEISINNRADDKYIPKISVNQDSNPSGNIAIFTEDGILRDDSINWSSVATSINTLVSDVQFISTNYASKDWVNDILGISGENISELLGILHDDSMATGILTSIANKANTSDLGSAAYVDVSVSWTDIPSFIADYDDGEEFILTYQCPTAGNATRLVDGKFSITSHSLGDYCKKSDTYISSTTGAISICGESIIPFSSYEFRGGANNITDVTIEGSKLIFQKGTSFLSTPITIATNASEYKKNYCVTYSRADGGDIAGKFCVIGKTFESFLAYDDVRGCFPTSDLSDQSEMTNSSGYPTYQEVYDFVVRMFTVFNNGSWPYVAPTQP